MIGAKTFSACKCRSPADVRFDKVTRSQALRRPGRRVSTSASMASVARPRDNGSDTQVGCRASCTLPEYARTRAASASTAGNHALLVRYGWIAAQHRRPVHFGTRRSPRPVRQEVYLGSEGSAYSYISIHSCKCPVVPSEHIDLDCMPTITNTFQDVATHSPVTS